MTYAGYVDRKERYNRDSTDNPDIGRRRPSEMIGPAGQKSDHFTYRNHPKKIKRKDKEKQRTRCL